MFAYPTLSPSAWLQRPRAARASRIAVNKSPSWSGDDTRLRTGWGAAACSRTLARDTEGGFRPRGEPGISGVGLAPRIGWFWSGVWVVASILLWAGTAAAQDRHAALVVDANNGQVLHAAQADEPRYPASLTKMMTLYLAFEAIEQGRATYATRIRVSQEAASQPPTKLDLDPGETIALIDAMKALITKSANDAAVAVAEHFGGTEARFARMMTDKARLFGMSRTTFRNASGLPDPGQVTTARDMVRLALRLQDDFPQHYKLFAMRSFAYEGASYRNHNTLLHRYQGTDGIKTGYTRASGFNLVSSVRRGGRHVVGAIFGGSTAGRRDDAMQLLLSRALNNASPYKTRRSAPVLVAAATPAVRPRAVAQPDPQTTAAPLREAPRPVMVPSRPVAAPVQAPAPVAVVRPQLAAGGPSDTAGASRFAFATPPVEAAGAFQRVPERTPPAPQQAVARGNPPSSLQQQAAQLASGGPGMPAPYGVRGPRQVETASVSSATGGGYEIQIGAYGSSVEADRALVGARSSAADLLATSPSRTFAISKDARQVFRARFVGFDSRTAASTCLEMRRRQIDCFVMRSE